MIEYFTSEICLLTKVHSGLLISKEFFQVEYSIIGQMGNDHMGTPSAGP